MKIALIHTHAGGKAGGGGGVRQMLELGLGLQRLGHAVTICCHDHSIEGVNLAGAGGELEIRSVRSGEFEPAVGARAALRQVWREMPRLAGIVPADVDVINAHEYPALRAGRIAAGRLRVPFVWTRNDYTVFEYSLAPGDTPVPKGRLPGRIARAAVSFPDFLDARRAAAIVVLDTRNARMVSDIYRREARIIRSGPADFFFDPPTREQARAALGMAPGEFLVLGVGILLPHRRFEDLIEAVALLGGEPPARALIMGADYLDHAYAEALVARAARLGIANRVQVPRRGFSDAELHQAYAAADAFVFPNHMQTWGLAPLEALASGTPVVVSSGAGVHEVLDGRPGVIVVPPLNPEAIAGALREMRDGEPRAEIESTRGWIRRELNNTKYAEKNAALFERLIA